MSVVDAPARSRRRGALGWVALVVGVLVVAVVGGSLVYGGYTQRAALDPESAGPDGTRAVVRLLEQQGVRVTVARDREAAERALEGGAATLALRDAPMLSDDALRALTDRARHVVLLEPRTRALDVLLNGSLLGGFADDRAVAADCDVPAAENAGAARVGESMIPGDGVQGCFPVDGGFGLLSSETAGRTVTALDALSTVTNATLPLDGNAALALAVLGQSDSLVFYVPSPGDADRAEDVPTLADLTPPWVSPVLVLLLVAALAAALWRGRRFGPLVTERLPVTVRANETTEGRARLYATARDAPHALGTLRRAARERLGRLLGLPARSAPDQVVDAVAQRLGADRTRVRAILVDDQPRTDRDLVAAADRLRDLEASVRAAVRTEGTPR
ncbi:MULTISPECIES: DUF4350 domain-containing protein [Microbacterium]|uniref:DUF4350 domain-containing protein n=1 Tax=Microbacterium TaxID=33882 RepID=UPI0027816FD9|nr:MULTISPECIES: DUF4350 domain-containing protein [Microbacterium]MDQ1083293.1 hypothetical protein [Microbacterium sp. SORGH_AS_0344]MDQ1171428.1 hypothetical protein [Microbacterium proteolyticum]